MNAGKSKEMRVRAYLPKSINDSLLCFTFVPYKVDGAPDIVTCNSNGYMYEIKNKNITRCLNLGGDTASSVSCHYFSENNKIVIFYLVFTKYNNLLVIRRTDRHLKVVKDFSNVTDFEVYDFECLGFPQMKISFPGKWGNVYKFPVELCTSTGYDEDASTMAESLTEELQILNRHIDDLTEEYNHLKKLCDSPVDTGLNLVGPVTFSSTLIEADQQKIMVCDKWCKVYGLSLILGMRLLNISSEILNDPEFIINHKNIKNYSYSFFPSFNDIDSYLVFPRKVYRTVNPGEQICAVGVFPVPPFFSESEIFVSCHVTSSDLTDSLVREVFQVNIKDVASKTCAGLEERFTVEDLMSVMTVKTETCVRIQTEDLEEGFLESIMMKNLGFTRIKHLKDKLFYCTSTYLNEVFVALQHISANPAVWRMVMYTSDSSQIYFITSALYDLLPENTEISIFEDDSG